MKGYEKCSMPVSLLDDVTVTRTLSELTLKYIALNTNWQKLRAVVNKDSTLYGFSPQATHFLMSALRTEMEVVRKQIRQIITGAVPSQEYATPQSG